MIESLQTAGGKRALTDSREKNDDHYQNFQNAFQSSKTHHSVVGGMSQTSKLVFSKQFRHTCDFQPNEYIQTTTYQRESITIVYSFIGLVGHNI